MHTWPGPDPIPQEPRFVLPAEATDSPWHVLGSTEKFPYAAGEYRPLAAPDRVLWGTDCPQPNLAEFMPNDGDLVDLLPLMAPDPAPRQKLLVDNPARLYGFTD